jgi:hypothetical protein
MTKTCVWKSETVLWLVLCKLSAKLVDGFVNIARLLPNYYSSVGEDCPARGATAVVQSMVRMSKLPELHPRDA